MLEGQPQVSREDARSAAAGWLGQEPQLFTPVSDGAGVLPSWGFSAQVDGGELYVEVTKQGGQLLEILHSRPVGPAQFSREQAAARATAFLKQLGYPDMAETYFIDQGNILTINFAGKEGDVLCYPDLVKVSVALDNGGIVGLESRNYLMNHQSRSFSPRPYRQKRPALRSPGAWKCSASSSPSSPRRASTRFSAMSSNAAMKKDSTISSMSMPRPGCRSASSSC